MIRVVVDLVFYTGRKGGMESYVREVYRRIATHTADIEFIGLASTELAASDASWFPGRIINSGISGERRLTWALGELFRVARIAHAMNADILHCPANFGPAWSKVPVLLTVHDLLPFRHPEYVPGRYAFALRAMIRRAARVASRFVTVSRASAADLTGLLQVPATQIHVAPLAGPVNPSTSTNVRPPDRLLAVGNRMPHKNFERLLEALALIPAHVRPHLTITGSHGADPLAPLVKRLGLEHHVTLAGWLGVSELSALYRASTLVVFPTLFEGFGLPTLEAMSQGCPVACSDIPVLHEVAGEAAEYFDPLDPHDLAHTITSLLGDADRLAELSLLGLARASEYSWDRTAKGTAAAIQSLLR